MGDTICLVNTPAVFHFHLSYEEVVRPQQAIFGGNITGRRLTGVKINPLFLEGHSEDDVRRATETTTTTAKNGYLSYQKQDPAIQLEVYDLRSPAHSTHGGNGKRSTVLRIGRNEVLSVSTSERTEQEGEATTDYTSIHLNSSPCTSNGHVHHMRRVSVKRQNQGSSYIIHNNAQQESVRTNEAQETVCDNTSNSHHSPGRQTCVRSGAHVNKALQLDSDELMEAHIETSGDVREVVVQFSESVVQPDMDWPASKADGDWPATEANDDWPAMEDLVRDSPKLGHSRDITETTCSREGAELSQSVGDPHTDIKQSLYMKAHNISSSNHSLSSDVGKILKPILLQRSYSTHDTVSNSSSSLPDENSLTCPRSKSVAEEKFVKFAEDTVDNENKTKRYRKERIDLREIYKGRIAGNDALIAKVNPLFMDDEDNNGKSMRSDIYHHKEEQISQSPTPVDLNVPSYMKKYLAQTLPSSPVDPVDGSTKSNDPVSLPTTCTSTGTSVSDSTAHEESQGPSDGSHDSIMMEVPGYEALIKKTLAKERRRRIIKWTMISVTIIVVVAVVIGVTIHFTTRNS